MLLALKIEGNWLRADCLSHRPLGWEGVPSAVVPMLEVRVVQ